MADLRPRCAVCGRKVERLEMWVDSWTGDHVFEVRCHGAREEVRLPVAMLQGLIEEPVLTPAVAFAARRIAP